MRVKLFGKFWDICSQAPNIAPPSRKRWAETYWLPELIKAWNDIEKVTGYRWRCTSYWRQSPSHKMGYALDIAPDIHPDSASHYAVNQGSDPVLYKRGILIRKLQKLNDLPTESKFNLGVYIEPDHLHLHVLTKDQPQTYRIFKWKVPKPVYSDSINRINLPMMN